MATFALTILAVMCGLGSLSDSFNAPTHSAQVQVLNINWFRKQPNGDDQLDNGHLSRSTIYVHLEYKVFLIVDAEYKAPQNSLNKVSLWDGIIPSKEHAKFRIQTTNKYHFVDQGSNLPGKEFNLTLHWHVMPLTGKMFADKIVMTGYHLPEDYR